MMAMPVAVVAMVMMMPAVADANSETHARRRRIINRRGRIDDRSRRIHNRGLLIDNRRSGMRGGRGRCGGHNRGSVRNRRRIRHCRGVSGHHGGSCRRDGNRLVNYGRRRSDINRNRSRPRLKRAHNQRARDDACQNFASGGPSAVMGVHAGRARREEEADCRCCHQLRFHTRTFVLP